jgi:hypothetical protein
MPAQLIQSHISAQAQARHIFLSAEKRRIEARLAEIDHELWLIRDGLWTGPITRHSTHSSASWELTGVNVQSFSDITQSCLPPPSMPPLNYRNLPQLLSGDDLAQALRQCFANAYSDDTGPMAFSTEKENNDRSAEASDGTSDSATMLDGWNDTTQSDGSPRPSTSAHNHATIVNHNAAPFQLSAMANGEDVSQNQRSTSYTGKYWMRLRFHWHNLMQDSPELVIPWAASVEDVVNLNPITGVMDRQGVT